QAGDVDWITAFLAGDDIVIDDAIGGGWFALNGDINGIAGDDLRVLVGQFTTEGVLSGELYVQIFPNGVGANEERFTFPFSTGAVDVPGCTNPDACNFDPSATVEDDSCIIVEASTLSSSSDLVTCAGDGVADDIAVSSTGGQGPNAAWVITDDALNILVVDTDQGVDASFDLEPAGPGTCLIWRLYFYANDISGAAVGQNAANLEGCFALSNSITVEREEAGCTNPDADNYNADACGDDGSCIVSGCTDDTACNYDADANNDDGSCVIVTASTLSSTSDLLTCAGDGIDDNIAVSSTGGQGPNAAWVITDDALNILVIDTDQGVDASFNLEPAGPGTCLIWRLYFDANDISGAAVGENAGNLAGCFALSNAITVEREEAGCTDPTANNFNADACADDGSCTFDPILGCTDPNACNFDLAADTDDGTCDFSCQGCLDDTACNYDAAATIDDGSCDFSCYGCTDATACNYDPTSTLDDGSCVVVSVGPITSSSETTICAGDGMDDIINASASGQGPNAGWVITTDALEILVIDLDQGDDATFNLEGAGAGTCLIWRIYFDDLTGAELGQSAGDLGGCFALSEPLTIIRQGVGCTDPTALNYDADACSDDGSCVFSGGDCVISCPDDMSVECGADTSMEALGMPMLTGDCDGYVVALEAETFDGDDCSGTLTRVWSVTFDGAVIGNCTQTTTIMDTEGPVFETVPADMTVDCMENVPAQGDATAFDACDESVDIDGFTSETGSPINECVAETAIAEPGFGNSWAIWLPTLEMDGQAATESFNASDLSFIEYADGTARLTGTVINSMDANQGWVVDFHFQNRSTWTEWSALGRSYKDDTGYGIMNNNFESWSYYEMVDGFSTLSGIGDYDGSVLYMEHMPASYFYGFQCGLGANNKNGNFGMSGWFTYEGLLNGEMVEG
ncbi:MAG: hypothetical protein AAF193_02520, partial [Bacteroidota bacterium]